MGVDRVDRVESIDCVDLDFLRTHYSSRFYTAHKAQHALYGASATILNMSLAEKRNLLLAAIREASSGGLITASTSVADLENDSTENSCKPLRVIPSKRLRIMDEFEDEESDSDVLAM